MEVQKKVESIDLVKISVGELGLESGARTEEIYAKAKSFGLEVVPPETAINLLLEDYDGDFVFIGMEPITGRDGDPRVFYLHRYGGQLELRTGNARPGGGWGDYYQFVFRKPLESFKPLNLEITEIKLNGKIYKLVE